MASQWSVQSVLCWCVPAVLCVMALHAWPIPAHAAMEGVELIPIEGRATPASRLLDGRLMMWWVDNKDDDPDVLQKAWGRYSSDNGYTWSEPELLFEFPKSEGKWGGWLIVCDREGVIHLFAGEYFHWSWEKFAGKNLIVHMMSADGGKTWTAPQYCEFGHQYTGGTTSTLELSTGRLVQPIGAASEPPRVRSFGTVFSLSDDGGKTWRMGREPIFVPGKNMDEAAGAELSDGRLWLLFRADDGYLYESYSSDAAETWSEPQPTQFVSPSAPPGVLRLRDGRIIAVWNNSLKPKHCFNRLILAAAISDDDGRTWQGYREIARTSGVEGPKGWVCYPWLTQAADGTPIVSYWRDGGFTTISMVRLDPDWLMESSLRDDFSQGLDNWITMKTEGATVTEHPGHPERQVLRLRKPNPEVAASASLNFPFGEKGHLTIKLRLQPGFQGARICLTDHFTWPYYAEDGKFGITIAPDGQVRVGTGEDAAGEGEEAQCEFTPTDVTLESREWYTLGFAWDCEKGNCALSVDKRHVADLPQLSQAVGVCYLRLLSTAEETDRAGLVVDSVEVE